MGNERELGTVYVTGGASGLGAAVVEAVSKAGGTPAVIDLVAPAPGVAHVEADLSDSRAAAAAVEQLVALVGPPSAVVTAAGTDACGALADVPVETWERVVAVNLLGTAAVVRAALPHLRARRGTRGHRRLHPRPARCRRRHGVLRVQVRGRRASPGRSRWSWPARSASPCSCPGGMSTAFFDGRPEQYRPGPDAQLNDPADVAQTVLMALRQPVGCEVRELVVTASTEPSWP